MTASDSDAGEGTRSARRLGGRGVLRGVGRRRRGGSEDPWLCGPGFRRVCLGRGRTTDLRRGTGVVKCGLKTLRPPIRGRLLENLWQSLLLGRSVPASRVSRRELHVTAHAAVLALV